MFKYYLAQRFSNSCISRTPKLPQIRPGRDPYLISLFSRLPHLMRFLSLDVLLKKLYETYYQISHTFCYLWLELVKTNTFFTLLGPPSTPSRKSIPRLWVSEQNKLEYWETISCLCSFTNKSILWMWKVL